MEVSGQFTPDRFNLVKISAGNYWMCYWMGPRADVSTMEERAILLLPGIDY
jgi:hypothetical protein